MASKRLTSEELDDEILKIAPGTYQMFWLMGGLYARLANNRVDADFSEIEKSFTDLVFKAKIFLEISEKTVLVKRARIEPRSVC